MVNTAARILVVDDSPLIRSLLEKALQRYGYQVAAAENGQQAIDCFLDFQPDLILMDTDMPVLDGIMACSQIKAFPQAKNLPIIMVTSFVEGKWVDRAYAAGATDYVTKPINLDVLRNRIHYILQAKQAEEALFDEKEKAQITLAAIGDGVITTNAQGKVEFLNSVAEKLTGWTTKEAYGLPLKQIYSIIDENTQRSIEFPLQRCLEQGQMVELSCHTVLVHRQQNKQFAIEDSAAPIKDRNGQIIGVVLVCHDVTENRKMTQELAYRAKHDALTGLWNLSEFKTQLHRVLQQASQSHTEHALLYMDLDKFKIVNDTCGHDAGDQLLKDVALILQNQVETHANCTQAILARLGGDEFGLLLEDCSLANAVRVATTLCEQIENYRFFWNNAHIEKSIFTLGISMGLVPLSNQTINLKNALAMADAACYAAKNTGRNRVHIYQQDNTQSVEQNNIQWVTLINSNLDQEEGFCLFYQSIIPVQAESRAQTGCHYEVLLRMKDAQGQLVSLGAFLSVATRYNLMSSLDLWVIRHLLAWLKQHPIHLEQLILATLNISGHSLNDHNFLATVVQLIDESSLFAHKLCFEISETTALTNLSGVLDFMTTLKPLGCHFALSNFGSAMASFAVVKMLPIEFLKIDGAFVKNMTHDVIDQATVKAINEIAHLMHLQTIAQSVENKKLFELLTQMNVDYVQGYWLDKPQPLVT